MVKDAPYPFMPVTATRATTENRPVTVPRCGTILFPARMRPTSAFVAPRRTASQAPKAISQIGEAAAPKNTEVMTEPLLVFFGR